MARPDPVNPQAVLKAYELRTGRQIKQIGIDTRDGTLKAITDWYNTDAGKRELVDTLSQFYDPFRADTIARTEGTYITSQVAYTMYDNFGVGYFNVDLADEDGEWPCDICREQAANNPHELGDEMPPFHPRDRCGTIPASADGGEFVYGQERPTFTEPEDGFRPDVGGVGIGAMDEPTQVPHPDEQPFEISATAAPRPAPRELPGQDAIPPAPDENWIGEGGVGGQGIGALGEPTKPEDQ